MLHFILPFLRTNSTTIYYLQHSSHVSLEWQVFITQPRSQGFSPSFFLSSNIIIYYLVNQWNKKVPLLLWHETGRREVLETRMGLTRPWIFIIGNEKWFLYLCCFEFSSVLFQILSIQIVPFLLKPFQFLFLCLLQSFAICNRCHQ